jgi:hypothetical protein
MTPVLPFAAGLIAGAAVVGLLRSQYARESLSKVGTAVKEASEPALAAVKRSAESLRHRFGAEEAAPEAAPKKKAAPRKKKPAAKRAPRKAAPPAPEA